MLYVLLQFFWHPKNVTVTLVPQVDEWEGRVKADLVAYPQKFLVRARGTKQLHPMANTTSAVVLSSSSSCHAITTTSDGNFEIAKLSK